MNRTYRWFLLLTGSIVLIALAIGSEGRLWGQKVDAPSIAAAGSDSFVYVLDIAEQRTEYEECLGLGSRTEVMEQTMVTPPGVVAQKIPGALEWPVITLRRSTPSDGSVWQWRKTMEMSGLNSALRDGQIHLYRAGSVQPLATWRFENGWPAELTFGGSVEKLVIVHEGLELVGAGVSATRPTTRPGS